MTTTRSLSVAERIVARIEHDLAVQVPSLDTDLVATGLLDSLALVNLVVGLEDEFEIAIPLGEFDVDNFRSVTRIVAHLGTLDRGAARG